MFPGSQEAQLAEEDLAAAVKGGMRRREEEEDAVFQKRLGEAAEAAGPQEGSWAPLPSVRAKHMGTPTHKPWSSLCGPSHASSSHSMLPFRT